MKLNQGKIREISMLAMFVVAIQIVLTKWIYPLFNGVTQQIYSINPATGVTSDTIGMKVIGFLSGIIEFSVGDLTTLFALFIGTSVLLVSGYWVYEQKWAWKGKNIYERLWAVLLYGSVILYVALLITNLGVVSAISVPLLIGVGVNYLAIAIVVSFAAKRLKFLRI